MEKIEFSTERLSSIEAKLLQQSVLKDTLPTAALLLQHLILQVLDEAGSI